MSLPITRAITNAKTVPTIDAKATKMSYTQVLSNRLVLMTILSRHVSHAIFTDYCTQTSALAFSAYVSCNLAQ